MEGVGRVGSSSGLRNTVLAAMECEQLKAFGAANPSRRSILVLLILPSRNKRQIANAVRNRKGLARRRESVAFASNADHIRVSDFDFLEREVSERAAPSDFRGS